MKMCVGSVHTPMTVDHVRFVHPALFGDAPRPKNDQADVLVFPEFVFLIAGKSQTKVDLLRNHNSGLLPISLDGDGPKKLSADAGSGQCACNRQLKGVNGASLTTTRPQGARGHPGDGRRTGVPVRACAAGNREPEGPVAILKTEAIKLEGQLQRRVLYGDGSTPREHGSSKRNKDGHAAKASKTPSSTAPAPPSGAKDAASQLTPSMVVDGLVHCAVAASGLRACRGFAQALEHERETRRHW